MACSYVSIHADPANEFPYFSGRADEQGEGEGEGFNLNIPLARPTPAKNAAVDPGTTATQACGV